MNAAQTGQALFSRHGAACRLPDFVIGGAPRSGTTLLCEILDKHPGVFVAKPFIPERKVLMVPHREGDEGFLAAYDQLFAQVPDNVVTVEKTSYYLENEDARQRFSRLLPQSSIIFILRDPIERAYSNWLRTTRNQLETLDFETAVKLQEKRPSPLPPGLEYARPFDYLIRSKYGSHISAWIDAIGKERIKVIMLEEAMNEPDVFIADLQAFMKLDPLPWSKLETGAVNALEDYKLTLSAQTDRWLRDRLQPDMQLLAELCHVDVGRWGF